MDEVSVRLFKENDFWYVEYESDTKLVRRRCNTYHDALIYAQGFCDGVKSTCVFIRFIDESKNLGNVL